MLLSAVGDHAVKIATPVDVVPQDLSSPHDCFFYHVTELPNHDAIKHPTSWDLRGRFHEYLGGVDVRGKTFLDVGASSGFISFEAEKNGAKQVFSFDAASADNFQFVPYLKLPDAATASSFTAVNRAYWYTHKVLNSKVQAIYGDIYKLAEQVPQVDIVLMAQILVHLEQPLRSIAQAAKAARETLIITDGSFEDERPLVVFLGGGGNYYSWYHHSVGFYRTFLPIVGFELVSATKNTYRASHPHVDPDCEVWTFVARRSNDAVDAWS